MANCDTEKQQHVKKLNQKFLSNASEVFQFEWKTCIRNLIEKMSMDFSSRYFPGFDFPDIIFDGEENESDLHLVGSYEKNCAFLIYLRCRFEPKSPSFKKNIQPFIKSIDLLNKFSDRFWIYNLVSSQSLSFDEIDIILNNSHITLYTLPNLIFDPLYREFMDSDVYHYFTCTDLTEQSSPYFIPGDKSEGNRILSQYRHEKDLSKKRAYWEKSQRIIFKIEAQQWFSHPQFFNDFFQGLGEYFTKRIPSEAKYIESTFTCYTAMFKLLNGRINYDISYNELKTHLQTSISKEMVEWFLNRFFLSKRYETFSQADYENPPCSLLHEYRNFIKACGYIHFGRIYTGIMVMWKAFFKYVEELAQKPIFRTLKGQLMENCVLDLASDHGFAAYKLILKDSNQPSTERYYLMKSQIGSFPDDKIIELEVDFPRRSPMTFMEYDVVIQINSQLLFCEVKSTAVEVGIQEDVIKWNKNIKNQFELLRLKKRLFKDLFMAEKLQHEIFQEKLYAKHCIIKSEGIFGITGVLTLQDLNESLKTFSQWIEEGIFMENWKNMKNGPYWKETPQIKNV